MNSESDPNYSNMASICQKKLLFLFYVTWDVSPCFFLLKKNIGYFFWVGNSAFIYIKKKFFKKPYFDRSKENNIKNVCCDCEIYLIIFFCLCRLIVKFALFLTDFNFFFFCSFLFLRWAKVELHWINRTLFVLFVILEFLQEMHFKYLRTKWVLF